MNISCQIVTLEGKLKQVLLPEEFITKLSVTLATVGQESVVLSSGETLMINGLYIPSKGTSLKFAVVDNLTDSQE